MVYYYENSIVLIDVIGISTQSEDTNEDSILYKDKMKTGHPMILSR